MIGSKSDKQHQNGIVTQALRQYILMKISEF